MKNEPAFPCGDNMQTYKGMTTLEWFAGQALIGVLSGNSDVCGEMGYDERASWCYNQAEAMIAEKEKRERREQ